MRNLQPFKVLCSLTSKTFFCLQFKQCDCDMSGRDFFGLILFGFTEAVESYVIFFHRIWKVLPVSPFFLKQSFSSPSGTHRNISVKPCSVTPSVPAAVSVTQSLLFSLSFTLSNFYCPILAHSLFLLSSLLCNSAHPVCFLFWLLCFWVLNFYLLSHLIRSIWILKSSEVRNFPSNNTMFKVSFWRTSDCRFLDQGCTNGKVYANIPKSEKLLNLKLSPYQAVWILYILCISETPLCLAVLGTEPGPQHWAMSLACFIFLFRGSVSLRHPVWATPCIPPASASQRAGFMGVRHHTWLTF